MKAGTKCNAKNDASYASRSCSRPSLLSRTDGWNSL